MSTITIDETKIIRAYPGINLGNQTGMVAVDDADARDGTTPQFDGQLLIQKDTNMPWVADSDSVGDWRPMFVPFSLSESPLGTTPSAAIHQHLFQPDADTVIVDYPENITATGDATHQEVLDAAVQLLKSGTVTGGGWQPGEIRLQNGTYSLSSTWNLWSSMSVVGAHKAVRATGYCTILQASAGFSGDYLISVADSNSPPTATANGNTSQHISKMQLNCLTYTSGILFRGAQVSSLTNLWIQGPSTYGVNVANGSHSVAIRDCMISATKNAPTSTRYGVYFGTNINVATMDNCFVGGDIAIRIGSGCLNLSGVYAENPGLPLEIGTQYAFVGGVLSTKAIAGLAGYNSGNPVLVSAVSADSFELRGVLKDQGGDSSGDSDVKGDGTVDYLVNGTPTLIRDCIGDGSSNSFPYSIP